MLTLKQSNNESFINNFIFSRHLIRKYLFKLSSSYTLPPDNIHYHRVFVLTYVNYLILFHFIKMMILIITLIIDKSITSIMSRIF